MSRRFTLILAAAFLLTGSYWAAHGSRAASEAAQEKSSGATAGPEDKAIQAVLEAIVAAFNRGDAKALAAGWSETGVYLNARSGEKIIGRAAIEKDFAAQFAANKGAQLEATLDAIRTITADVAAVEGKARTLQAGELPAESSFSMILVRKDGKWFVDSVREIEMPAVESNYAQLKELEWMVGDWVDTEEGIDVRTVGEWIANKNFLARTYTIIAQGNIEHQGTQIIGWDSVQKTIRSWNFDSDGTFGEAVWSRQGNRWICKATGVIPGGKKAAATQIITRIDDNKYTYQAQARTVDGQILPNIDEVTMIRKAAQADGKKKEAGR